MIAQVIGEVFYTSVRNYPHGKVSASSEHPTRWTDVPYLKRTFQYFVQTWFLALRHRSTGFLGVAFSSAAMLLLPPPDDHGKRVSREHDGDTCKGHKWTPGVVAAIANRAGEAEDLSLKREEEQWWQRQRRRQWRRACRCRVPNCGNPRRGGGGRRPVGFHPGGPDRRHAGGGARGRGGGPHGSACSGTDSYKRGADDTKGGQVGRSSSP